MKATGINLIEVKLSKDSRKNQKDYVEEILGPLSVIVDARVRVSEYQRHLVFFHEVRNVDCVEASNGSH